jgi:zinc protease
VSVALASHLRRSLAARCVAPRPRRARAGAAAVAVAAVTLAAASASVLAQAPPAPERPAVGPARPFQLAPRAERTLPNGLHVIVTRQTVVPKVSVTLTVRAGYSSDPADLTGLAALTGDLIQEGTRTRSSQEIRHQVFGMGGSLTASASQDFTTISARGLAEFASGLIGLVADVAMNPTFPAEELAIMKEQHLQGVEQQAASPQFLANREFRRQLFGSHPYARTSETAESIGAMDRDRIVAFHRDHYRPNNAFLLIVGDVQAEQVFAAADTAFAGWARGDVPQPTFAAAPALTGRHVYFVQRPNSIQSSISVGNLAAKRSDPRWFDMTLANSIFGGAFDSRIIRNIREDKGYTYSPSSAFVAFANAGFYKFGADVRNEVTGATLTEVFKEIDKFRAEGSDGTELAGAKSYLRGVFALQTATQGGLSATLNNVYVFNLPKDYPETFRSTIAELTPVRVKAGANALLGSADAVIVIVGDYAKVKDQLGAFKDITFLDINGNKTAAPAPQ